MGEVTGNASEQLSSELVLETAAPLSVGEPVRFRLVLGLAEPDVPLNCEFHGRILSVEQRGDTVSITAAAILDRLDPRRSPSQATSRETPSTEVGGAASTPRERMPRFPIGAWVRKTDAKEASDGSISNA
jgi:hypothetical protein